ncbi:MAG: hypothetical protein A2104_06480 [Candidatus Melainabacteria bacterium GWF2_32_7]|nr:MAG: hypothetical protein A2104_06480 [Candidatus Melainabacteria bacterium GWF2_32_7]
MLKDILQNKKCFKLICGAGNENIEEVEKLVALYAKAGANFFDLSASEEVMEAALRGLKRVVPESELKNYHLCVSIGAKDDPHFNKAVIDKLKCVSCGNCIEICPQKAIILKNNEYLINEKRCIGCGNCKSTCLTTAISFYSKNTSFEEILSPIAKHNISCIELHASCNNEEEIYEKWQKINHNFDGILSICLNRTHFGDIRLIELIKQLLKERKDFSTIIQADGCAMSGLNDEYKTTLQAIAMAEIIQNANLPVFIMICGGTNSKSSEFAKLCNLDIHGVAIGSFARKIVRQYTIREDFFENQEIFNQALKVAKSLVDKTLKYLT